jgi:hypothetical protein
MNLNVVTEEDAVRAVDDVKSDTAPAPDIANESTETDSGTVPQVTVDDLYSRLLKFIPAPLIGIYLMVTNLILDGNDANESLLWIVFAFFVAATAAYLMVRKVKRIGQIAVSVLAFGAFAAASPGPFQQLDGWESLYGTLALAAVAVVLIVFKPSPLPKEA